MSPLPPELPLSIPPPDQIRAAIDAADEQASLLRRLLRLSIRLHGKSDPAGSHTSNGPQGQGAADAR